jgi:hypothetical protein
MRAEVERFCEVIDQAESLRPVEFLAEVAQALAELVAAVGRLPDVDPTDADLPEEPSLVRVRDRWGPVESVLGDSGWYSTTPDACIFDAGGVWWPLTDDLVDVWADVKRGLVALDLGAPEVDVLWQWRFDFYAHWGRHATDALRALHARLAETGGPLRTIEPS